MGRRTYKAFREQLEKDLGRDVPKPEAFLYSRRGKDGTEYPWPDEKSQHFHESIEQTVQLESQGTGSLSVDRLNQIYDQHSGEPSKGNHFGHGGALPRRVSSSSSSSVGQPSRSSNVQLRSDVEQLQKKLDEETASRKRMEAQFMNFMSQTSRYFQQQQPQQQQRQQQHQMPPYQNWGPPTSTSQGFGGAPLPFAPPAASSRPSSSSQPTLGYCPDLSRVQHHATQGNTEFGYAGTEQAQPNDQEFLHADFVNNFLNPFFPPAPPGNE